LLDALLTCLKHVLAGISHHKVKFLSTSLIPKIGDILKFFALEDDCSVVIVEVRGSETLARLLAGEKKKQKKYDLTKNPDLNLRPLVLAYRPLAS